MLADAFLVAGQLNDSEADFMFGYGVLLQLMDDLQDINDDRANGHATIFVRQAEAGCLDEVTSRLWSFLQAVLWTSNSVEAPRLQPVKTLIQENCKLLLLQAVARNHQLYSPGFVAEMERGSPFRFDYLRAREKALAAEGRGVISLLRRRRQIQSAFDLLG